MALALLLFTLPASAQGWPIESRDEPHHLMSAFEFMKWNSTDFYVHRGLDIFAPSSDEPDPPWVIAISESLTETLECDSTAFPGLNRGCLGPSSNGCWTTLRAEEEFHVFGHLDCGSFDLSFMADWEDLVEIVEGSRIGRVQAWEKKCCKNCVRPTHLHLERKNATTGQLLDPTDITLPYGAKDGPPTITGVWLKGDDAGLATSDPWPDFPLPSPSGTCQVVSGAVDIVVGHDSRHRAGASGRPGDNLGVRQVRWRACGGADPDCAWEEALDFASIDASWVEWDDYLRATYSLRSPLESDDDWICGDNVFYTIATNVVDHVGILYPDEAGAWETPGGSMPSADEQHATVAVEVEDFAGASATELVPVCTPDAALRGVAKLLIRDCEFDDGAEPSNPSRCEIWTESPDVVVTLRSGSSLVGYDVLACVRNVGNAAVDPLSTVNFVVTTKSTALGSTTSRLLTLPVGALGPRGGGASSPGGWSPGEERCANLSWSSASPPTDWRSHDVIEVTVERSGDRRNAHPAVSYDNNRAQRTVDFSFVPVVFGTHRTDVRLSEEPAGAVSADARVVILSMLDRYWEHPSKPNVPDPAWEPDWVVQVFVGPGIAFSVPEGGTVLGAMRAETYRAWDGARPMAPGDLGLELAGGAAKRRNLGQDSSQWRVIEVAPGAEAVRFHTPSLEGRATVALRVWRREPDGRATGEPPPVLVRVMSSLRRGGPPVEWFQRRLHPAEGGAPPPRR